MRESRHLKADAKFWYAAWRPDHARDFFRGDERAVAAIREATKDADGRVAKRAVELSR